ncbi:MAG: autotransporter outer membrane beta-barrel domain-containing protein [Deltaproteobacteria bacterium]|nr:autotransporter outer membrane beta-barrel domain-containing protein [Deltaproteobacteria bacterium]
MPSFLFSKMKGLFSNLGKTLILAFILSMLIIVSKSVPLSAQADINSDQSTYVTGGGGGGGSGSGGGGGAGGGGASGGGGGGPDSTGTALGGNGGAAGSGGGGGGGGAGGGKAASTAASTGTSGVGGSGVTTTAGAAGSDGGTGGTPGVKGVDSQATLAPGTGDASTGGAGALGGSGGDGGNSGDGVKGADGAGSDGGKGGDEGKAVSGGTSSPAGSPVSSTAAGNSGTNGSAGAKIAAMDGNAGNNGTAGTDAKNQATVSPISVTNQNLTTIKLISAKGGLGGEGGSGGGAGAPGGMGGDSAAGTAGNAPASYAGGSGGAGEAAGNGGIGGHGEKGGNGGNSSDLKATVTNSSKAVEVQKTTLLTSGNGGIGGEGGNSGNDVGSVFGGKGAIGGDGGNAGSVEITFTTPAVTFKDTVILRAGDAGKGGKGGDGYSVGNVEGNGGKGGNGGNLSFTVSNDMRLDSNLLEIKSGIGGNKGTDGIEQVSGALKGTGGTAGTAGNSTFSVTRDLLVQKANTSFNFTKGSSGDTTAGGTLKVDVKRNLEISKNTKLVLNISGRMVASQNDNILFQTLLFGSKSSLETTANVYTANSNKPTDGAFYQVRNLDVITNTNWSTQGTFSPNTSVFDYIRIDMSDIAKNAKIVDFSGAGTVDLTNFNPMLQQEKYLKNPNRPKYSDNSVYRTYTGSFDSNATVAPAFLTSAYQPKILNLGKSVLISKTNGATPVATTITDKNGNIHFKSDNSALGTLYNDFAYTSGLRRYYFDVYIENSANKPLVANNYYTADASKVFAQSALSGIVSVNQTFENTLGVMERAFGSSNADKVSVTAAVGGSSSKIDTGSYIKVKNFSTALSVSKKIEHGMGESALGIFGEFSDGSYDNFSSIPRYGDVFGGGDVKSYGAGLFFKTLFKSNTYVSASFRGGGINNEFKLKKDPWTNRPEVHSSDTDSSYLGGHIELGQKFNVLDNLELEGYGMLLWTHSPNDMFTTKFGDRVNIDSFNSTRAKLGARIKNNLVNDTVQWYFGLAMDHEFDGKMSGKLNGDTFLHNVEAKGTSGFGELGINIIPRENISISIGAYGWTGQIRGAGGNASINFSF